MPRRMLKKAVQQGRSERRFEAYPLGYVEGLNDVRTMHGKRCVSARLGWAGEKSDFFSILSDLHGGRGVTLGSSVEKLKTF
jgi:hypothetical protein